MNTFLSKCAGKFEKLYFTQTLSESTYTLNTSALHKIHQHRDVAASGLFFKTGGVEFRRVAGEQSAAAFAAVGLHAEAFGRHPVYGVTFGTNYVQGVGHWMLS